MAKKKQPDKDGRSDKDKPEKPEDLSEIMSMDEDWEILELTERTIVRQAPEDEETISLSPPADDNADEEYVFVTDEAAESPEAGDDVMNLSEPESDEDEQAEDEDIPRLMDADDEPEEEGAELEDITDFSELESEAPPPEKAEKKKPARAQTAKKQADRGRPALSKTVIGIIALLSVVMVSLIVVIVMLLQRQPGKPVQTASDKAGQTIARNMAAPEPVAKPRPGPVENRVSTAKTIPTPKPRLETPPQPAPPARPAIEEPSTRPSAIPESPAPGTTTRQFQPAAAMRPEPEQKPVIQQPAALPAVNSVEKTAATAQPDENMVHILHNIDFQETGAALQMKILANGPVGEYKSFPLSSPSRLVIDLFGKWDKPSFLEKKVATGYISRIRLGQHDDKLRIVADLRTDQALSPAFTPTREGLTINLTTK